MTKGVFKEYTLLDIYQLIYKDNGLLTKEDQRTKGQIYKCGHLVTTDIPEKDKFLEIRVYDKTFEERMEDLKND